MQAFVVMQGDIYHEEKEQEMIWAPQKDSAASVQPSWVRLKEVQEGDRIFHYVRGNIVAIGVAKTNCEETDDPLNIEGHDRWDVAGYQVKVKYHELEKPINIHDIIDEILPFLPVKYSPFNEEGNGNSGYLYPCNERLAIKLLELISDKNIYRIHDEQLEFAMGTVRRTKHNVFMPMITEAEAEMKTKLRVIQQSFRLKVMELWECKCALCDVKLPELLQASRSKPWKDCTDRERMDPYNGLLLCRNHDALYDQGFIAFDGRGGIHISSEIKEESYDTYDIHSAMKVARKPENKVYFRWQRKYVFKEENSD